MTDDRASSRLMAEIYGHADGRWTLMEAMAAAPREAVLRRAREISSGSRIRAVRVVMEKADEGGGTRAYVAWRAQKAEGIPELDLSAARSARLRAPAPRRPPPRPAEPEPLAPPPLPRLPTRPESPVGPASAGLRLRRPGRRTVRLAALGVLAAGALTALLAAGRSGMDGNGALLLGTGAGLALMVSGLWIARELLRIDPPAPAEAEAEAKLPSRPPAPPAPAPEERAREPEEAEAPPSRTAAPDPLPAREEPDRVALLPVLRLTAAALRRLEEEGGSLGAENEGRLALRLYIAGACDERAARLGTAPGGLVAGGLELLGEEAGDAAGFADALDDALLSPGHQILYRAGRVDLAAFAQGGTPAPGLHRLLPGWLAWCAEGAKRRPAAPCAVLAVAPLAPGSIPALEAVVRAFDGEPFSRDGTALVASFAELSAARAVAEAVRDAADGMQGPAPGCALGVAEPQQPGRLPRDRPVARALALARGAPGAVSTLEGAPAAGIPAA